MATSIRILVVEDDPLVLSVIEHALKGAGYEVVTAASAADATFLLHDASDFAAMVTDINLNGALTGWDIAKHARKINHALPILYLTGPGKHDFTSQSVPDSALLIKPFAIPALNAAISQLLKAA